MEGEWMEAKGATGWNGLSVQIPRNYLCYRAEAPLVIDGRLDKEAWQAAPWTEEFVDIEGDIRPRPRYRTRARMLWDDAYLYIAAELEEPHIWATLTEHDSVIFQDNDFEVFIDPDSDNHQYYEIEINALNTEWDLRLVKPYRDGGPALNEWEILGLKTAIHIDGTLNDPTDTDRAWSVEMALPWSALAEFANRPAPPRDGDRWRINFSRVEWDVDIVEGAYRKVPGRPEHNWVWSPQGVIDMHRPEKWGYVQFVTASPGQATFLPDPTLSARDLLMRCYYQQRHFKADHSRYAATAAELLTHARSAPSPEAIDLSLPEDLAAIVRLQLTDQGYTLSLPCTLEAALPPAGRLCIDQDSRIWTEE